MGTIKNALALLLVVGAASAAPGKLPEKQKDWWETASVYQIYPRSYKDSDGDGIGDLRGIIENLDHLKDAGIQATWLSPIFKSPMFDVGYDISDFYSIQPEFGTMEDFDDLIKKAEELGIKIILDLVPNHSSNESEWFKKSIERDPEYEDFYVWHPGKVDPANPNGPRLVPNNWLSAFQGSVWEWNEQRGEFYLHQFTVAQPDFNYENIKVRETMKHIIGFWLDKGAYGFRVDAVPYVAEDSELRDEPKSGLTDNPADPASLIHIHTQNLPLTYEVVREWRQYIDEYNQKNGGPTRIIMLETYASVEQTMAYFGNDTHPGAHFPFNFFLISDLTIKSNARDYKRSIDSWLDNVPEGQESNWVIGNHDKNRVSTRLGVQKADAINILIRLLPGVGVTYQGEEIAMEDVWLSWDDTLDPWACNTSPEEYEKFSRDPARTPIQWDSSTSAGFSTNPKTWLPVSPNYKENNLAKQQSEDHSHYKLYQKISELRLTETIQNGNVTVKALTDDVLAFTRELEGSPPVVVVLNLGNSKQSVKLQESFLSLPKELKLFAASVTSNRDDSKTLSSEEVVLDPYEALVLTS